MRFCQTRVDINTFRSKSAPFGCVMYWELLRFERSLLLTSRVQVDIRYSMSLQFSPHFFIQIYFIVLSCIPTIVSTWGYIRIAPSRRVSHWVWCSTIKEHPHWLHQSLWQTRWAFVTKRVSDVTLSCVNILRLSVVFIIASEYTYIFLRAFQCRDT